MGPSGNGLVERMNAGEIPRNQGRRRVAPVRFQKAVLRSKETAAVERREARRSASWIGNPVSQTGWFDRKANQRVGVPARDFRRSATLFFEVAKGSKPTI